MSGGLRGALWFRGERTFLWGGFIKFVGTVPAFTIETREQEPRDVMGDVVVFAVMEGDGSPDDLLVRNRRVMVFFNKEGGLVDLVGVGLDRHGVDFKDGDLLRL
jgi:hypothetical protein